MLPPLPSEHSAEPYLPVNFDPAAYLPPLPAAALPTTTSKRFAPSHLKLVPLKDTRALSLPGPGPDPLRLEETFLLYGWQHLTIEQQFNLLKQLEMLWKQLTPYQRDCMVVQALGGHTNGGAVPQWSRSENMARQLINRVDSDIFRVDDFSDILYQCVSTKTGIGLDGGGLPLLDPRIRARHHFSLRAAETPDDISFAFVVVYRPQVLFEGKPAPVTNPFLPALRMAFADSAPTNERVCVE